ncbi:polyprotein [Clonorchis sinensis]|uniref:Polyprotein n=1 Tax=Clonorchis sinensis TaxID=79923 RepID=G7YT34_CLOSI|nr:polyprotein [Clonorchis sinensis]
MKAVQTVGNARGLLRLIRESGSPPVSEGIKDQGGATIFNKDERRDRWAMDFEYKFSWPPVSAQSGYRTAFPSAIKGLYAKSWGKPSGIQDILGDKHNCATRTSSRFISVNCNALFESEVYTWGPVNRPNSPIEWHFGLPNRFEDFKSVKPHGLVNICIAKDPILLRRRVFLWPDSVQSDDPGELMPLWYILMENLAHNFELVMPPTDSHFSYWCDFVLLQLEQVAGLARGRREHGIDSSLLLLLRTVFAFKAASDLWQAYAAPQDNCSTEGQPLQVDGFGFLLLELHTKILRQLQPDAVVVTPTPKLFEEIKDALNGCYPVGQTQSSRFLANFLCPQLCCKTDPFHQVRHTLAPTVIGLAGLGLDDAYYFSGFVFTLNTDIRLLMSTLHELILTKRRT